MKEKNGFFAKTENKVEILTKIFFGCNVLLELLGKPGNTEKTACTENGRT